MTIFIFNIILLYLLDFYLFKSLGVKLVLAFSLIISSIPYAYYFYRQKSKSVLVIYLFLLGTILYVNSVDYAFNNILEPHQKERVSILLGLKSDPHGTGYNVNQSIISIGSGQSSNLFHLKAPILSFVLLVKREDSSAQ
jgi:rod shape determining protein RodA